MQHILYTALILCTTLCTAQTNQQQEPKNETPHHTITDAQYQGTIEDLYYNIYNNYTFQDINKKDIPNHAIGKTFFIFYVKFAIDKEGKPFEFSAEEIDTQNPLYTEAVRVISTTKWHTATQNQQYKKQYIVIPIKISTADIK